MRVLSETFVAATIGSPWLMPASQRDGCAGVKLLSVRHRTCTNDLQNRALSRIAFGAHRRGPCWARPSGIARLSDTVRSAAPKELR
jgi:hypothetical protein